MWSTCFSIGKEALNSPLLDLYHNAAGVPPPPERHLLEDQYLNCLDTLTIRHLKTVLKQLRFVALSEDGWSNTQLKKYITVCFHYIDEQWRYNVLSPDIIPIDEFCSTQVVQTIIDCVIEEWTSAECLVSAITTDNGSVDRAAAANVVGNENRLHCARHNLQLCVTDVLQHPIISGIIGKVVT